jgi:hypothetical protein
VQIASAPEDCLVRTILTSWYEGKKCVICGRGLGEINLLEHRPALMTPERVTIERSEIPPDKVPKVLAIHLAVCWDCHIPERFRRRYTQLFIDRP